MRQVLRSSRRESTPSHATRDGHPVIFSSRWAVQVLCRTSTKTNRISQGSSATSWLYLFLVPAIGMRFWATSGARGRRMLLTCNCWATVLGKIPGGVAFTAVALCLTFRSDHLQWLANPTTA